MDYPAFLERVINDGIEAAKHSYDEPRDAKRLEGSVDGFEACREADPAKLAELLSSARTTSQNAYRACGPSPSDEVLGEYWYWTCYAAEIEWVCNVVSAAGAGVMAPIVSITARGAIKAAEILGVAEA